MIIGIRLFRANKFISGTITIIILILIPILIITHGGIMIHGGGDILIGGEGWAIAVTIGDIMMGTMAVDMVVEEALAVDMVVEEALAVDMGDS
ncbi:MAG: hypothetical protein OS130_12810 [Thermodesulfobacteriota bacterium]|nr:MAG: hypothetical protein OS130_12810 [Thermodesulfobacteriota bacterium]